MYISKLSKYGGKAMDLKGMGTNTNFESEVLLHPDNRFKVAAVAFSTGSVRKYTWEYIKHKQEREKLSNAEIEALENERKTTYQACFADDSFLDIPKMVYNIM